MLAVLRYDAYHNLEKLRKPVDKDKWSTEPAVVNAFYNPNKNDIGKFNLVQIELNFNLLYIISSFYFSFSRGNPSATLLLPAFSKVVELWWNRCGDWP